MKIDNIWNIIRLDEVDSTNEYAKRNVEYLPNRSVIISKIQTAGKGQYDREWVSDVLGNLYMSILFKGIPIRESYSIMVGYILYVAIRRILGYRASKELFVREPNDIYYKDKKLAGILIETGYIPKRLSWVVIGIGVNVVMTPKTVKDIAISFKDIVNGKFYDSMYDELIEKILKYICFIFEKKKQWFHSRLSKIVKS
jgi:biotin-[acetyl-CoA-carboxylase] ligase BirA-like protein